jgi:hypothetical protein
MVGSQWEAREMQSSTDMERAAESLNLWRTADQALLALARAQSSIDSERDRQVFTDIVGFLDAALSGGETVRTGTFSIQPATPGNVSAFRHTLDACAAALEEFSFENLIARVQAVRAAAANASEGKSLETDARDKLASFLSGIASVAHHATARELDDRYRSAVA